MANSKTLTEAIFEARKEIKNPPMNGQAQYGKYAVLGDVLAAILPPLQAQGVMLSQRIMGDTLETVAVKGEETLILDKRPIKLDGNSQQQGSAETYARRYALCTIFCLVGQDDDDGAAASTPKNNALQSAKERVWAALKAQYGEDKALSEIEAIKARDEFKDTAEFWNRIASVYEGSK